MLRQQMRLACQIFCKKKLLTGFVITAVLLSAIWTLYVFAVQTGQLVSAVRGYFVCPICTVLLGIVILGKRLDRWAWLGIGCVALGILAKAGFPSDLSWLTILIAGTFSLYAVTPKRAEIEPILGVFVETLLLLLITIGFFGWLIWSEKSIVFGSGAPLNSLVMFIGVPTIVPLILFHRSKSVLSMTASSLLFCNNPTT